MKLAQTFKKTLALVLCIVMVLCLAACGETGTQGGAEATDGEKGVVVRVADIFNTLNPFNTNNLSDQYVFNQVYETLAVVGEDGSPVPCLAESWEISEDGKDYTIHLVQDAVFHNGEKLTAEDVAFTYTYAKDFSGRQLYYKAVQDIEIVDDYTLIFHLDAPTPLFLAYSQSMPIMNKKFVEEHNGDVSQVVCGTGPYTIEKYDPAVEVVFTAFENYRLGVASIKKATLKYMSDDSSAVIALKTGDVSFMSVPTINAAEFSNNPDFSYDVTIPMYTAVIAMNNTVAPFDNKLVRQAFAYACDREKIIEIAYDGLGTPACFMCYDQNCAGVDYGNATDYSYNPEMAKQLLAEAGYPDGLNLSDFGIQLKTFAGYHSKIAQIYQQDLANIGVNVEIVNTETPDEDVEGGNFAIMNQGITYRADFSYSECHYGSVGVGGNNYAQVKDPYADEMFAKALKETDDTARFAVYKELIPYLIDYCPNVYVFHKQQPFAWAKDLTAKVEDSANFAFHFYEWSWNN